MRVKGFGLIRIHPHNEKKLEAELAAGGRIQEIKIVRKALRVEVHLGIRTVVADPVPHASPTRGLGIDVGREQESHFEHGGVIPVRA